MQEKENNTNLFFDETGFRTTLESLCDQNLISNQEQFIEGMMTLVKMANETPKDSANLNLINQTLSELRQAFKLFSKYQDARTICLFGSARTAPNNPEYLMAEEVSRKVTEAGFLLITGAGGGIMEAGNKGALASKSFGVNIHLPFEQEANPYIKDDPKLISFRYFFTRKLTFVRESDATILYPGGFGTMDELFEILTLIQTGHSAPRPILLMSQPDSQYWEKWLEFIKEHLLDDGYISSEDLSLFKICKNVDEALEDLKNFFTYFNSVRYIGKIAHLRLNKPLPSKILKRLNSEFKDIVIEGKIEQHNDVAQLKDKKLPHLSRLVFHFNKVKYGRLMDMIYMMRD